MPRASCWPARYWAIPARLPCPHGSPIPRPHPLIANSLPWFSPYPAAPLFNDESAFSISRNNGETWNQLAFIDTTVNFFNDFAISADCNTLYLASVSFNGTPNCRNFDSVWRSSLNPAVVAPLPPIPPLGYWYA